MLKCLNDKGFTLIEMMVAIIILVVMMLTITRFFVTLYREQGTDVVRLQSVESAGRAIDNLHSEVRKMNRGANGSYYIASAQAQTLIFYSDVDNDGLTEKIEYILNGTNLERKLTEPGALKDYSGAPTTTVVVNNVVNGTDPVFQYYDENYIPLASPAPSPLASPVNVTQIKLIEIDFDISTDINKLPGPIHVETKIQPRNLPSY